MSGVILRPSNGRTHFGQRRGLQLALQADYCRNLVAVAVQGLDLYAGAPCELAWLRWLEARSPMSPEYRALLHGWLPA